MHFHSADLAEGAPGIPSATPIRRGFYQRAIRAHGSALMPRSVKDDRRDIRPSKPGAIWSRRHDRTLPQLPLYSRPAASRREADNRNKRETTKPSQHALDHAPEAQQVQPRPRSPQFADRTRERRSGRLAVKLPDATDLLYVVPSRLQAVEAGALPLRPRAAARPASIQAAQSAQAQQRDISRSAWRRLDRAL